MLRLVNCLPVIKKDSSLYTQIGNMDNNTSENISVSTSICPDELVPGIFISVALGIIILIVNVLTLTAIILYDRAWENYIILIASLTLADALVGLSLILELLLCEDDLGFTVTQFVYIVNYLSTSVAQWHTVVLSIDRWIAVYRALNYHSIMSPFRIKLLVAASWVIASVEMLIAYLLRYLGGKKNDLAFRSIYILTVVHLIIIFSINAVIYGRLWAAARRQRRQIAQLQQQQNNTAGVNKATIMVMVIVALFGLLWAPLIFANAWFFIAENRNSTLNKVHDYARIAGFCNSLINCVVYVFFNKNLRKLLHGRLACK